MLTIDQFSTEFKKLQASFGLSKSEKILDTWYEEFEYCELKPFRTAMRRCQYGEKFPNWDVFKTEYRNCLDPIQKQIAEPECKLCRNGVVLFQDLELRTGEKEVLSFAANCNVCSMGRSGIMINLDSRNLARDNNNHLITRRALQFLNEEPPF